MGLRVIALAIGVIAVCALVGAQPRPSLAGTWTLTPQAGAALELETPGNRRRDPVGAAINGLDIDSSRLRKVQDPLRGIIDTPQRLSIVQTESMVIVTASNGYTMRLSPGTRGIKDESTGIEMKTRWNDNALVTEITGLANGKIVETFSMNAAHQLHVVVTLPVKRQARVREIHRIYEALDNSR